MLTKSKTKSSQTHVGVLLLPKVQLLDAAPIDLFAMLRTDYLTACRLPAPLLALGQTIDISYISASPSGPTTASTDLSVTHNLTSPETAPGKLDILLVPGPDPSYILTEDEKFYIRSHVDAGTTLMLVCTGIFAAVQAGILDGRTVTGPRALLGELRGKAPAAHWVEKRWARDPSGKLWSSGGITNGLDMVAAYIKLNYPSALANVVCAMADVGDRGDAYPNGNVGETSWWVWQIFKAWVHDRPRRLHLYLVGAIMSFHFYSIVSRQR